LPFLPCEGGFGFWPAFFASIVLVGLAGFFDRSSSTEAERALFHSGYHQLRYHRPGGYDSVGQINRGN